MGKHVRGVLIGVGAVVLVVLVTFAGGLSLQACALNAGALLARFGACPPPSPVAGRLAALEADRAILLAAISEAETALVGRQCTAQPPDPNTPFDRSAWQGGDRATLHGCWSLDSTYRTRDVDSGVVISYPVWTVCFDTEGQGYQQVFGDDGSVCEGPVTADMGPEGRLVITEPGNLPCSDGGYIHQRQISCAMDAGGLAQCDTFQPETEGQATVGAQRIIAEAPPPPVP